jgi:hypothetical protein
MDKETLVTEVNAVLNSFLREGKDFSFAALVPIFPGLPSTSYTLLLNGKWLRNLSVFESTKLVIERIFQVVGDPEIRQRIDSVDVWQKGQVYPAGIEAEIILDTENMSRYFNYAPTTSFSGSLFANGVLTY